MKSSTNRALVAKKQSTSFAQVATSLLNVLQGCSKSIRLLLVMFLTLIGSGNAWGGSIVLTYSDFGYTSNSYSTKTCTKGGVSFTCTDGSKNVNLTLKKSSGEVHNTTEMPGNITSIVIEGCSFSSSSSAGFYVYGGTSASPTTTTLLNNTGGTETQTASFSGYSYKYFKIQNKGTRAFTNTKITINYEDAADPALSVSTASISSGLTYVSGSGPSTAQTFTVSGSNLTSNVTVTAPTNFEVSKDGSSYAGSQTITASGTLSATTIYVRLKSGLAVNSYSGNITVASTGATSKTVSLSGSVTAPAYSVTWTINPAAGGTLSATSGTSTTVTPNAAYTYGSPAYTVTSGAATVSQSGNTFTATPTEDCSIQINMVEKTKYTVTWNVNGEVYETTQVTEGSKPTFPTTPSSCDATSNTFYGWATATWDGKIDDINGKTIYTSANEMPEVDGAVTYYAVFAKATTTGGGGSSNYEKVTSNLTDWAGDYLIAYNNTTFADGRTGGTSGMGAQNKKVDLSGSISNNTIPASVGDQYNVTLEAVSGGYVLKTKDGKYNYQSSNENGLATTEDIATATKYAINVTCTSEDDIKLALSGSANGAVFRYNTSGYFRFYKNGGQSAVYLYKKVAGGSTTYDNYITTCAADPCASLQAPNVTATATANSITLSWDAVDGATSYNIYNYTTEDLDETTSLTYTFTGLSSETEYEWGVESAKGECFKETRGTTTTSATPCEKLGAATGLTVETDFVQDGQTYVKFSWTPADNTKANATSQKICFGKVDEAGTCVDNLAKNLTWTGDLKSKLEPGEYWWSIQALGDEVNYCDGDVVNGTNFTIEAPTYTVTFNAGSGTCDDESLTETSGGAGVTLPTANPPAACATDGWEFAGWWTEAVAETTTSPGELLTAGSNYKPASDCTLHAVYSYTEAGGSGGTENVTRSYTFSSFTAGTQYGENEAHELDDVLTLTTTQCHFTNELRIYSSDAHNGYVVSNQLPGAIKSMSFNVGYKSDNLLVYGSTDGSTWTEVGSVSTTTTYADKSIDFGETNYTYFKLDVEGDQQVRIATMSITYMSAGGGGSTTYNSNPTCLEPVWNGATIDKTALTVNCGGRSPMTGANGAAIISFPTEDIYNFTKDIKIEATTGFLVSTSQSEDANYKSSVSLSPLVGTVNANTFYDKHVYVRAEAPAMSEEDLSGTITIKNNKGETLQTFSVTADVTCTQYTLTLVDRGVSTEQATKYYAGETINEAPADPKGVCTDPIHYVFDGWAEATVAEGSTTYTKVTFPYTVEDNTKFYAVYRYLEGGGNGDYNLVTSALDDWSGDYLIAYSDQIFANGTTSGESGIGAKNNKVDLSSYISGSTIPATEGDKYKVTLEAVTGGYVLKTQDGKYNYHTNNTGNGISASTIGYADDYPITVKFVSQEEINLCLGGSATGSVFRYNTDGYFRFYKNGGQQSVYLYKKADGTTYYTTSPVCGPHLAITEGKDIYVTGGNAGGPRDLVIAQQKVSYKATRLQTSNGLDDGTAPDVKVATNGITVGGVVTSDVKVTIDQTKEQQTDGTYTITGTITVQYQPSANNKQEDIQVQLAVDYNAEARDNFIVHARSLPAEFVIVAKSGDKWYALNGDMNTNAANPANGQVTLDNVANPTKATYAPCNTIYTFDGVPNTGDRTYVRFQGTDGAWLWASSGTNVGIQNNVLKTTPEGNNNAYNWKLYTQDNITYQFGNANNSRQLTLSGEKFGMYASGVQDIRILPYDAKCLYNYAPSNLKVSVLKGTYVTLTWDAVAGATKYQYSTDATNWTDAGTEPTVTVNGLTGDTEYTYYIRAYHEDAGVSQECIDYAEITFTTADCDDVPADITYTADMNSIIVSWIANAATSTVNLYSDEEAEVLVATQSVASPCTFMDLAKNTQYYVQILANGTCASPIIPVKTEDVEVDIVEWYPQGIIVDINTDETVGVTLENEVSYGSGMGTEATELFFSKYYEATTNVKLVAIYNGTKNIIDLTDYTIQYGKKSWESNYITLKDFGATKGQIQPGEEIILYSKTDGNTSDESIMSCVNDDYPDGKWVQVTQKNNDGKGHLAFAGDKTIILCKKEYDDEEDKYYDNIIDVIGALKNDPNEGILPTNENTKKPSWGDDPGWVCETGLSIADDSQIGISTNRCLLIRNNTVTSGDNAVTQNIDDFVTLCSEWKGAHVPKNDIDNGVQASCDNFAYVGTFDYSDYYTKYETMGDEQVFDENARNADGTVTIEITDLYKHACSNIRVKLTNSNSEVLSDREYKVPIMITTTQGTNGQAFLDLQQNLATKEVDGEGNVINTYPLSLDEVREICKTCDVVVRDNATLTKVTDGTTNDHPQVRNVYVYEGASIVIPDGVNHNYTVNGLSLRRKGDEVASAQVQGTGKFVLPADEPVCLDLRVDANNWHWFTLPFDCDIADVTWIDGTPAKYNTDWFLMYYDGESRAASTNPYDNHWKVYNGTTIEAGKGYIVGITGDLAHPKYTFELRFPMAQGVLTAEQTNKTVPVNAWGVKSDNTPNNLGWNLVGNPYLNYYKTADEYSPLAGLPLIHYTYTDPVTGEWYYENSGSVPYVATPIDGGWYEYRQELASEVNLMPFTAYFVQVGDPNTHENGQALDASFLASNRGKKSIVRRAPREVEEIEEPIIVRVELTNSKGESDKTSLVIDDRFTNEYEMNGDFFKWFGDYYNYYTKPVLYTIGADQGKRAFNALNEELAKQPIPMGMYAAQAGNYTFSLNQQFDLSRVEEVWLYDATQSTYTNLMQSDYTFSTSKVNGAGRFSLSVKLAPKVATSIDNVTADKVWATTHTKQVIVNGLESGMHLWLYDATGKLLYTEPTSNYQHTYSVPQTGTYFVSVMKGSQKQTIKVVVE